MPHFGIQRKVGFTGRLLDLREILVEVSQLFMPVARSKGLDFKVQENPDRMHTVVRGDPVRIRQILLNLVGNAVKFTARGEVGLALFQCRVRAGATLYRLAVYDSGIGIDEAARKHLFQPFNQLDSSITRAYGGSGLGLAIVARLVQVMGGQVGLKSRVGEGSIFWVDLELEHGDPERCIALQSTALTPGRRFDVRLDGLQILLAEDYDINREVMLKMLAQRGALCDWVANGAEVLEALTERAYDLLLMDLQMPVMDGYQALREIRRRRVAGRDGLPLKVVAVTAEAMHGDREKCLSAGMDDYLAKPFGSVELDRLLLRMLGNSIREGDDKSAADEDAAFGESEKKSAQTLNRRKMAVFKAQMNGDIDALVDKFCELLPRQLAAVQNALGSGDLAAAGSEAHKIKSAAGMLGAEKLTELARHFEAECRGSGGAELLEEYPALVAEAQLVLQLLQGRDDDA
ncbi:MAG: response regulator [Deltaproteobacteria bacterium]|nr:response regulator [Deltaproteobacteria bacterium]